MNEKPPIPESGPDLSAIKSATIEKLDRLSINQLKKLSRIYGIYARNDIILDSEEDLRKKIGLYIEGQEGPVAVIRVLGTKINNIDDLE